MASYKPSFMPEVASRLKLEPINNPGVMNITIQKRNISEYTLVGGDHYE